MNPRRSGSGCSSKRRLRHMLAAAAVFLVVLAVRLLFLLTSLDRTWPHSVYYEGDALIWARCADALDRGELPDDGLPFRSSAAAHLFHWLQPVGPARNYLAFKIGWCVAGALACAVGYACFRRSFGTRPALMAAGLCVFSFGQYVNATSLNIEGSYTPLLMIALWGTLRLLERPSIRLAIPLAVVHGIAILVRVEHMLLLVVSLLYLLWRWHRTGALNRPPPSMARRLAVTAIVLVGAILVCVPSSVQSTRATTRYNTIAKRAPNYGAAGVRWTADARAFVESLPAFARADNVEYISHLCRQRGIREVTGEQVRQFFLGEFGYIPEPLSTPVFVSSQGPLSFAFANHPASRGGFSKAPLDTRFSPDPKLTLALPTHLRIYNHGYAVGWGYIKDDFPGWLRNVGRKLLNAYDGAALGFTAYNLPIGRAGERRPCDLLTPFPGTALAWRIGFGVLLLMGCIAALCCETGGLWLLVIAYKLVVIVAYFGYARQTVSILPVFLVLVALGLDQVFRVLGRMLRRGLATRWQVVLGLVAVVALSGVDIHAALHPPHFEVKGPVRPLPQWGPSAFSCNARIEVRVRPTPGADH